MPAGPGPVGLAYYAAIKFAGYTAAASYLKRRYPEAKVEPWLAGGVRTLIGIAVGVAVVFFGEDWGLNPSVPGFFVLLVPTRILEWLLLLFLYFEYPWNTFPQMVLAGHRLVVRFGSSGDSRDLCTSRRRMDLLTMPPKKRGSF